MPSRRQRWLLYGLNASVYVLAVIAIVIFLNWIMLNQLDRTNALRFDMTASGLYSLSDQTQRIVGDLDQSVQATALLNTGSAMSAEASARLQRVQDLLNEYAQRSDGKLELTVLDPTLELDRYDQFAQQVRQRYATQLKPTESALELARGEIERTQAFANQIKKRLDTELPRFNAAPQRTRMFLEQLSGILANLPASLQFDAITRQLDRAKRMPLPDYAGMRSLAVRPFSQFKEALLTPAVDNLKTLADQSDTPPALKEVLLALRDAFQQRLDAVNKLTETFEALERNDYDQAHDRIMGENVVVLMSEKRLSVVPIGQMFIEPQRSAENAEPRFIGEEKITGALLSLTMKQQPMVVFVNAGPRQATGPGGDYSHVASILENMNFDVREWTPGGRMTQYGPLPAQPKPEPEPGQTQVLIGLPALSAPGRMPFNPNEPKVVEAVRKHLESGQPALLILGPSQMTRFGQPDNRAQLLEPFGITARTGSMVMEKIAMGNQTRANPYLQLTRWPQDHPISAAIGGLPGLLVQSVALEPAEKKPEGVTLTPLAVTEANTWLESDFGGSEAPEQDADEKTGPFTIAMAVERGEQRVVAIGDTGFANNQITQFVTVAEQDGALQFVQFPANAELFANSVYWLSGLDELIATSFRPQDVRRFSQISDAGLITVRWVVLAALPVGCLLAGGLVWIVRRK